jgi:Zn-dependent peptidase ImmA (M78 family)/DNA-binding XRE family transcriptional regulator
MPPRIEALITAEILVWARNDAGYSIERAAEKLNISVERLGRWEAGELRPTIAQLRKIAVLYKRPLSVFYLPRPPKSFQPLRDFRRFPDQTEMPLSPNLIYEIRLARERRETALELFDVLKEDPPSLGFKINIARDPEVVAHEIRQNLNVPLKEQYSWAGYYPAFGAWRKSLENAGILVFQASKVSTQEMRGFSIPQSVLPIIVVNSGDWIGARIFSLIHEFVHILREEDGLCDFSDYGNRSLSEQKAEVFCNHVAGAFLVPPDALLQEESIKRNGASYSWEDNIISTLAKRYKVSREVILRRLLILGKTTYDFYEAKRAQYLADGKFAKPKDLKIPIHIKILARTGPSYARLILTSFSQDKITASEASSYLGLKLNHIPKLEAEILHTLASY